MIKNPRIVYRLKRALVRCSEGVKCSYFCCNLFWLHVYNIFRQIFYCKPQSHHTWAEKCGQWIFNWWRCMSKFRLNPQRTYYTSHSSLGFDASYHLRIEAGGPQGRAAAAGPDTAHSQIVRIWWRDDHPDPAMVPHSAHPSAWWTSTGTPAAAQHHEGFHYSQNVVMCLQNNFCQPQLLPSENFISPACHFIPTSGLLNHACWGPDKVSHFNIRQSKMQHEYLIVHVHELENCCVVRRPARCMEGAAPAHVWPSPCPRSPRISSRHNNITLYNRQTQAPAGWAANI